MILSLDSLFTFGKHQDDMVEDVIEDDPGYIEYLINEGFEDFDEETLELIAKKGIA